MMDSVPRAPPPPRTTCSSRQYPPVPLGTQTGTHLKGTPVSRTKLGILQEAVDIPVPRLLFFNEFGEAEGEVPEPISRHSPQSPWQLQEVCMVSPPLPEGTLRLLRSATSGVPCAREMGRRQVAPSVPEAHQMLPSSVGDKASTVTPFPGCHQQLLLHSPSSRTGMASKGSLHMFRCRVLGFSLLLMQNSVETPS